MSILVLCLLVFDSLVAPLLTTIGDLDSVVIVPGQSRSVDNRVVNGNVLSGLVKGNAQDTSYCLLNTFF